MPKKQNTKKRDKKKKEIKQTKQVNRKENEPKKMTTNFIVISANEQKRKSSRLEFLGEENGRQNENKIRERQRIKKEK